MPYFTVAQGLQGLEGGLRTGMPEFSVFIVNTPVMFGMIQGDQGTVMPGPHSSKSPNWAERSDHNAIYTLIS